MYKETNSQKTRGLQARLDPVQVHKQRQITTRKRQAPPRHRRAAQQKPRRRRRTEARSPCPPKVSAQQGDETSAHLSLRFGHLALWPLGPNHRCAAYMWLLSFTHWSHIPHSTVPSPISFTSGSSLSSATRPAIVSRRMRAAIASLSTAAR